MKIGVLALQGAVREHIRLINELGVEAVEVKEKIDFQDIDGLIIPGGESTTIGKLIKKYHLQPLIMRMYKEKKPIFGTCAGLIMIAKEEEDSDLQLGLMDIQVKRNAFGRQKDSFEATLAINGIADEFQAIFIRAPYVEKVGPGVDVLATYDSKIVAVRQERLLGAAFHPELTNDLRFHNYFIKMVEESLD